MTVEYKMLIWSILLGVVQLVLAVLAAIQVRGLPWALSPRDPEQKRLPGMQGRLERAFSNLMETFPFFAAAVATTGALNVHNASTVWGAELYFWARLVYVPVYAAGIPGLRTAIWGVSVVGIVLLAAAVL